MQVGTAVALAALVGTVAGLEAQGFVVPSKAQVAAPWSRYNDGHLDGQVFPQGAPGNVYRVQYLYDVTDIPVAAATIRSLDARPRHDPPVPTVGWINPPGTWQTTVRMSVGPNASSAASATFASNHGTVTTVFSGSLSLPASYASFWPAPWLASVPFSVPVPFANTAGRSLVVDFETRTGGNQMWELEGYAMERGMAGTDYLSWDCQRAALGPVLGNTWGFNYSTEIYPGGSFWFGFSPLPPATPSFSANALAFGLGGVGSNAFGYVTPVSLNTLGLPAPPSCDWAVGGIMTTTPMIYRSLYGLHELTLTPVAIPNDPRIAGAEFYTQNLAVNTDPNGGLSLYPSPSIRWRIGTGRTLPAARVISSYPVGQPASTGHVQASVGISLRLGY